MRFDEDSTNPAIDFWSLKYSRELEKHFICT